MGTKRTYLQKLNWLDVRLKMAKAQNRILNLDLTMSEFCLDNGCNLRTAKEVFKIYEMNGKIKIVNGEIEII